MTGLFTAVGMTNYLAFSNDFVDWGFCFRIKFVFFQNFCR